MEVWFLFAVASVVTSGIAGFSNKISAHHNFDSSLLMLYSGLLSALVILPSTIIFVGFDDFSWLLFLISFMSGIVAAISGLFKIQSLKHIDATIFFPLFKIVSPLIAIIYGILFFSESFSGREWLGLILSLCIPLLLINKIENNRQNHLSKGLLLMVLGGVTAALVALIHKYSVGTFDSLYWIVTSSLIGVFVGGLTTFLLKQKTFKFSQKLQENSSRHLVFTAAWRSACLSASFIFTVLAFSFGGTLGIVYTINSLYILIPIVLSIYFYNEHWNTKKLIAIVLSVLVLGLFA